jgi:WASH complex subunit 7
MPIYLTDLYENAYTPNKLQFMILAVRDCLDKFALSRHQLDYTMLTEKYLRDLVRILDKNFLQRICRDIETDLRLSIHLDLKSDESKLFKDGLKDLSKFVNLQPIVIDTRFIDIKAHVRKYLEKVNIQRMNLQLLDDTGRVIHLNGADFSVCLRMVHE